MQRWTWLGLVATLWSSPALANGVYAHVYGARLAAERVDDPELAAVLDDSEARLWVEVGAMLPDSRNGGLVAWYHWETFVSSYVVAWQAAYPTAQDRASDEAQRAALFLLGAAVHGVTDPYYDGLLLARSEARDPGGGPSVDRLADYFVVRDVPGGLILDTPTRWEDELDKWLPIALLQEAYRIDVVEESPFANHSLTAQTYDEATIRDVFGDGTLAVDGQGALGQTGYYEQAWELHPFLGSYLLDPEVEGSLPASAEVAADYMEVLWRRLHGTDEVDDDLVLRALPADGAVNVPVDPSDDPARVLANVGVITGYGVLTRQTRDFLRLLGPDGEPVSWVVDAPYDRETTSTDKVHLQPLARPAGVLAYDSAYTIEVLAGFPTISGEVLGETQRFTFRTRCAPDKLADCPPLADDLPTLDPPWERPQPDTDVADSDEDTEPPENVGPSKTPEAYATCGCGQGREGAWWILGLLAVGLRRRRG